MIYGTHNVFICYSDVDKRFWKSWQGIILGEHPPPPKGQDSELKMQQTKEHKTITVFSDVTSCV
jgi:hypothetical protein